MQEKDKPKWYYTVRGVVLLILLIGPVAFIFLWKSKQFSLLSKILVTIIVIVITIWTIVASIDIFRTTLKQFQSLGF